MAVAFRSSSTAVATTTITKPAGVADGDILLLCMIGYDNSTGTFTPPSGFTSTPAGLISIDNGIHDTCMQVFWKVASGEGASYTATFSAGSPDLMMAAYTGGDTAAPIGVDSGTQHVASTSTYTATWTPVTSPRGNSMAVAFFGGYEIDGATPAGYTSRINALDTVNDTSDKTVTIGENVNPTCSVAADALSRNTAGLILVIVQSPASALPPGVGVGNEPLARTSMARASALALSGGAPLMPMAAAAVVVQPRRETEQIVARRVCIDPGAAGSALPPQAPVASPTTMTWFSHSPLRIRTAVGTDAGADAISPLSSPQGSWYPQVPDMGAAPRRERDAPGSGLVRPLTASAVIFVQPGGDWVPRSALAKRVQPADDSAPSAPLGAPDLSWAPPPPAVMRRAPARVDDSPVFLPVFQPQAPSWLPQPADVVARRPRSDQEYPTATLPVFQPQAPSWLVIPVDVVVRRRAFPGAEVMVQPAPVSTGFDLSWAVPVADRPAARRQATWADAPYPATLTVNTLSPWGWIPSGPERPGLRVVVSQPFSDRQDPILVAPLLTWGWLPSGPDKPAPRVVVSQPFSDRMNPITVNALSSWGWLPDGPDRPSARAVRSQDPAQVPGAPTGLSAWGWSVLEDARPRRPAVAWDAGAMVPGPTASTWGWLPSQPDPRARRAPLFEAPSYAPGPIPGASLEWATQPSVLAVLARRPLHEQAQVVRALVAPGMEWLVNAANPIARRRQVEAPQAAVPQPAIVPLPPWWEPEPPRVVRRARIQPDDPQPPPGVLIIPPLLTMLLPYDAGRPARRVVLPFDFSVVPGGTIEPPPPVVLRLFSMAGAVSADVVRVYFGDGTDADA